MNTPQERKVFRFAGKPGYMRGERPAPRGTATPEPPSPTEKAKPNGSPPSPAASRKVKEEEDPVLFEVVEDPEAAQETPEPAAPIASVRRGEVQVARKTESPYLKLIVLALGILSAFLSGILILSEFSKIEQRSQASDSKLRALEMSRDRLERRIEQTGSVLTVEGGRIDEMQRTLKLQQEEQELVNNRIQNELAAQTAMQQQSQNELQLQREMNLQNKARLDAMQRSVSTIEKSVGQIERKLENQPANITFERKRSTPNPPNPSNSGN
jgi:hypothetical protein